jgi:hypothetical protein
MDCITGTKKEAQVTDSIRLLGASVADAAKSFENLKTQLDVVLSPPTESVCQETGCPKMIKAPLSSRVDEIIADVEALKKEIAGVLMRLQL